MNINQIIEEGLKANGFDGLVNRDVFCACVIGNISPEECVCIRCEGGYRSDHSTNGAFVLTPKQYKFSDEEIEQIIKQCG